MTYLLLEDRCICPFCLKDMRSNLIGDTWTFQCSCEESQNFFNQLSIYDNNIKLIQETINKKYVTINEKAILMYQEYFKDKIVPELLKDVDNLKDSIMEIKEL